MIEALHALGMAVLSTAGGSLTVAALRGEDFHLSGRAYYATMAALVWLGALAFWLSGLSLIGTP